MNSETWESPVTNAYGGIAPKPLLGLRPRPHWDPWLLPQFLGSGSVVVKEVLNALGSKRIPEQGTLHLWGAAELFSYQDQPDEIYYTGAWGVGCDHSPWAQGIRGPSPQYSKIWTGIHKINLWKSWNHTEFWGHGKVQWISGCKLLDLWMKHLIRAWCFLCEELYLFTKSKTLMKSSNWNSERSWDMRYGCILCCTSCGSEWFRISDPLLNCGSEGLRISDPPLSCESEGFRISDLSLGNHTGEYTV